MKLWNLHSERILAKLHCAWIILDIIICHWITLLLVLLFKSFMLSHLSFMINLSLR